MKNKEIKNNAAVLNNDALENVNGGLLKPPILGVTTDGFVKAVCVRCNAEGIVTESVYKSKLINGEYYCDTCKNKMF